MGICYSAKKKKNNNIIVNKKINNNDLNPKNNSSNQNINIKKDTDDKETTSLPNTNGNNNIKIINSNNSNNNDNNNNIDNNNNNIVQDNHNNNNTNNNNNNININNNNDNNHNNIIIETEKDELIHNTQIENKSNTNYSKNIKIDKNNNYIFNRSNSKNDIILLDEPKLPFYYKLKPINDDNNNIKNSNITYSTENDFNSILMPIAKLEHKDICYQFLSLNQRNWFQDKINIYSILLSNRTYNNNIKLDSFKYKNFIHYLLKLQEDFNWLLWSMSYYIKNKDNKNFINNNNNLNIDINLIYKEGIIYKGIYFKIIKQFEIIKNIKNEIKCLNYSFLDYLQLLDNIHLEDINNNNINNNNFTINNINNTNNNYNNLPLLSNYLFFPLIAYSEFNGEFLLASEIFPTSIDDNNYDLNASFNLNDLNYSPIFKNLNKNHLIKINNYFTLINTNKLIPNLCENIKIKYSLLNNNIDITKDFIQKSNYISFLNYFINLIQRNKYINDIDNVNYEFNKFGINKFFLPYVIAKLKGENNNNVINSTNNIVNLIKIKILVKILFRCVNFDNNNNKLNIIKNYLFSILIPQKIEKNSLDKYLKNLLFFTKKYLINFHNICSFYFENINNSKPLFSNKTFIKSLILSARKFPFIFISEIERKFNIIFNHIFKYKISISIENFYTENNNNFIEFNEPKISTFLNGDDIFYYLFAQNLNNINISNNDNIKEENNNNINNSIDNISMINRSIIPKDNYNYNILNSSRDAAIINNNNNNLYNNINDDKIIEFNYDKKSKNTSKENQNSINQNNNNNYAKSMKNNKNSSNINTNTINNFFNTVKKTPHHLFWKVLSKNYHIKFPPNLYKIIYSNKSYSSLIYKNLSFYYSFENMSQTIIDLKSKIEFIFNNEIISINNKTSNVLIYLNIYLFLHFFYIENDKNESKEILENIINFIDNKNIYINNEINIIINILCGIFQEKNNFFKSEYYYSKSLIFSLFKYGEPRGKNNEANLIMLLPLYKVGRDSIILDNNDFINENFKEIFHCLNFCYNHKKHSKYDLNNNNNIVITNDLYIDNIDIQIKKKTLNNYFNNNFNDDCIENFNDEDDEMLERPSKISLFSFNNNNDNNDNKLKYNIINLELNYDTNNKEISSLPYFIFPSISDKKTNFVLYFEEEHFFIFLVKNIFNCINFSNNFYSIKHFNEIINTINKNNNNKNNINLNTVSKSLSQFCKYFIEILNFKDYHQNGILFSWGNNTHNETSHDNYDKLYLPRFVYKLKNKNVILVNSGWEFSIAITNKEDNYNNDDNNNNNNKVYSWGNNCNGQCGFDNNEFHIINTPKNIIELNNKNIIQISCGNEHCLALNKNGEVYSWGINEDGVLGFPNNNTINNKNNKNNSNYKITFKPTLINFFKENNIKIKYISSGSIHNIVITNSGLLYSFGCSKGGQLGIDENTLLKLYSSNKIKDDFSISTPTKIQNLENFQIKKVVCGEAHSIALTENGKVFVWGLGSYGQLGLGFSDENYEIGTGLNSSRRFVPIELTNDYFKNDINDLINNDNNNNDNNDNNNNNNDNNNKKFKINDIFLGKTVSFFLINNNNNNNYIYSCGLNDLNQCGFDYNKYNLTYIINPLKIEMLSISMKILKVSCGEGHVLAIVKDNTSNNELIFSWGSNKNGQLGLAIKCNKTNPTIINYFLNYKNKKIKDICCGAYHSFVILDNEKNHNVNLQKEKEKILDIINNINENQDNFIDNEINNNN